MSRKYLIFPEKFPRFPDSRQNLQIPGINLFFSRNSPCQSCHPPFERKNKNRKKRGRQLEVTNLAFKLSLLGCLKARPAINLLPFGSLRNIQVFNISTVNCCPDKPRGVACFDKASAVLQIAFSFLVLPSF